ncbi:MAG: transposase [Bdellovibrionaceae bacterium]|nr:transposase [Pseudobdellovibrionaceae bacterium]
MHLDLTKLRSEWKLYHHESEPLSKKILSLIELVKLKMEHGHNYDWHYRYIASKMGVSERSVYRWKAQYLAGGINELRPKKAPGKKKKAMSGWIAHHIKEMRLNYNWGAEVICAHLREDLGIYLSQWKVHQFLLERGFISRIRRRTKKSKHTKVVKVIKPGAHTQIDVKHLPHILRNKKKAYVYNFVDHASKWQFKLAFEGCGVFETVRFMEALIKVCPFKIQRLQSDNGSEFSYKHMFWIIPDAPKEHPLEEFCRKHDIDKKLIPVGEKEVNGLVERSHRMDDNELYDTINPINITHFNRLLSEHVKWLNESRRRKPLNWKTANEYLKEFKQKAEEEIINEAA